MTTDIERNPNATKWNVSTERNPDKTKVTTNKFYSIPYLRTRYLHTFSADEDVWIEEKIDGSNVSCEIDDNDMFRCYGRNYELGEWYTNFGAYEKLLKLEDKVRL